LTSLERSGFSRSAQSRGGVSKMRDGLSLLPRRG
jgi:hypothetical protein